MVNNINKTNWKDGVDSMTVNGVYLNVYTKRAIDARMLPVDDIHALGGGRYIYTGNFNREKLYEAAGFNTRKIDFAVPQGWLNQPENSERYYIKGDRAVWSYEDGYGQPVWDSEAWKKLGAIIKQRLAKRKRK